MLRNPESSVGKTNDQQLMRRKTQDWPVVNEYSPPSKHVGYLQSRVANLSNKLIKAEELVGEMQKKISEKDVIIANRDQSIASRDAQVSERDAIIFDLTNQMMVMRLSCER